MYICINLYHGLKTRKPHAIEYIAGLEDESIFNKIEVTILENKVRSERKLKPFTQKQLLERAEKSNSEYSTGRYKSQEALEKNRNPGSLMKVIWTDFAVNSIFEMYKYYKEVASPGVAHRIRFKLFSATRQLIKHPLSGQVEPNIRRLGEDHRYLVVSNN